jgi:hypothetical protein
MVAGRPSRSGARAPTWLAVAGCSHRSALAATGIAPGRPVLAALAGRRLEVEELLDGHAESVRDSQRGHQVGLDAAVLDPIQVPLIEPGDERDVAFGQTSLVQDAVSIGCADASILLVACGEGELTLQSTRRGGA